MPLDLPISALPEPVLSGGWSAPRYATGINDLDGRLEGLGTGELWVVTSAPGQGRSTLLTQIATHLATQHRIPTWLISSRDPAPVVSARAHSAVGRIPLNHLQTDRLDKHSRPRLEKAREALNTAPLHVVTHSQAATSVCHHRQPRKLTEPQAVFFDDPDQEPGWALVQARPLADAGAIVVVTLPREQVLAGNPYHCDLDPMMRLADVVVEVRLHNLAIAEPDRYLDELGLAAIAVIRNRRGPLGTVTVAFQGHYARFVDVEPAGPTPSGPGNG